MFDIGAIELLIIVIVAIVAIGPKDMPLALRTAGRWIGKIRRVSGHFRSGIDAMIREAEMEEMEKKWREQNARIVAEHPPEQMEPLEDGKAAAESRSAANPAQPPSEAKAEDAADSDHDQPALPLGKPRGE
jgi:sec-independent protein translocase protein TatB